MSNSLQPYGLYPARLLCPWDVPGKNTGVSYHFLLQCMKVKRESEVAQSCPTLSDPKDCSPPGSSVPGILQERILEWVAISFSSACIHGKSRQSCPDSERPYREQPTRLLRPQDSLGKNTGVGEVFAGYSKYQSQFLFTP